MYKIFLFIFVFILSFIDCKKNTGEIWYCPMHPDYTSDRPGTCPICNMNLKKKETEDLHPKEHNHSLEKSKEDSKEHFFISRDKQNMIGVKTAKVEKRILRKKVRAYSTVAYDPELYRAIMEYKEAMRSKSILSSSNIASTSNSIIQSASLRLKQLGLNEDQIKEWANGSKEPSELIIGSVKGKAYIYSQVFESDIPFIKKGQKIVFVADSLSGKKFDGYTKNIDTIIDEKSRTLRVRSEIIDPENILKPQMYGSIELEVTMKEAVSIPKNSVIDTGKNKVVYLKINEEAFQPATIQTGNFNEEYIEVLGGITEGQEVVVESNFLIDSEAKLKLGK